MTRSRNLPARSFFDTIKLWRKGYPYKTQNILPYILQIYSKQVCLIYVQNMSKVTCEIYTWMYVSIIFDRVSNDRYSAVKIVLMGIYKKWQNRKECFYSISENTIQWTDYKLVFSCLLLKHFKIQSSRPHALTKRSRRTNRQRRDKFLELSTKYKSRLWDVFKKTHRNQEFWISL